MSSGVGDMETNIILSVWRCVYVFWSVCEMMQYQLKFLICNFISFFNDIIPAIGSGTKCSFWTLSKRQNLTHTLQVYSRFLHLLISFKSHKPESYTENVCCTLHDSPQSYQKYHFGCFI